jgi:predicted secreted protein
MRQKVRNGAQNICLVLLVLGQLGLSPGFFSVPCCAQAVEDKVMVVGKEQDGQKLSVKVGDVIEIELPGSGATGYWWYLDGLPNAHLELISETTRQSSGDGKLGRPVMGIWRLRVLKEGDTHIKADYYRTWEGKEKSTDHFVVNINIFRK